MIRSRKAASLLLGTLVATPLSGASVGAQQYIYGGTIYSGQVREIADRCARLGQGFVDIGNGLCGRAGGHIRIDGSARNAALGGWAAAGGTSTADMRSSGPAMLPGATVTQHLRVRGNLDSVSPFR